MAARLIHRSSAQRLARGWYAGALVVALAGGALWALEVPGISAPADAEPPTVEPPAPLSQEQPVAQPPDADAVMGTAERLELARVPSNKPTPTPSETPTPPPVAAGIAWKYLGSIIEPTRKIALVSINGAQRMLAEGRTIQQDGHTFKVVEVQPDSLVVEDNGQRLVLQKEARSGPLVSWVSPTPGGIVVDGMNGAVGAMSGVQGGMNGQPIGRGYDPGEAERIREQIHARRAGRPGGPGGANGAPGKAVNPGAPAMIKGSRGFSARAAENAAGDAAADGDAAEDGTGRPMP